MLAAIVATLLAKKRASSPQKKAMNQRTALALIASLTGCGAEPDGVSPFSVIASSKYIDYLAQDADGQICMDDLLAELDHFVETSAATLGRPPPSTKIRYVFVPTDSISDTNWPCKVKTGCYKRLDGISTVFASKYSDTHELFHAVDLHVPAPRHAVFIEGLAEYLGTWSRTNDVLDDFPADFENLLRDGWSTSGESYHLAMHYVGALIEAHGFDKFDELRSRVPPEADLASFAAIHEAVYQEPLHLSLVQMSEAAVQGRRVPWGCERRPPEVHWTTVDSVHTSLSGRCGDGWYVDTGISPASRLFALDIDKPGLYMTSIVGPAGSVLHGSSCPEVPGDGSFAASPDGGLSPLQPGRYVLQLYGVDLAPAIDFNLEYLGSLPPN